MCKDPPKTANKCFVSYSWDSDEHKRWVEALVKSLRQHLIQVVYDQDRRQNPVGGNIPQFIEQGILSADFVLMVCTDEYTRKANAREGGVGYEVDVIAGRKLAGDNPCTCIPILRCCSRLPTCVTHLGAIDMSDDAKFDEAIHDLLTRLEDVLQYGDGIAPRHIVFGKEDIPGQVFNVELLTEPILLKKLRGGRTIVTVNRENVDFGVYNCKGRDQIPKLMFPDQSAVAESVALDKRVAEFMAVGRAGESFTIRQQNMRWASGAVLSIVNFRDKQWVPFFFRDIAPYGWQLPQGHSEKRSDDLDEPWTFIMREFLEEVLVCSDKEGTGRTLKHPFEFHRRDIGEQIGHANDLSRKHVRLRFERDSIALSEGTGVPVSFVPTNVELWVYHDIHTQKQNRDVLVLFNITELGIEVIQVIRFDLQDDQYILDGEIFDPYGQDQVELLRKPVALLSLDYLTRTFGGKNDYTYSFEYDQQLPSILGAEIGPDEVHFFSRDLLRRQEIALSQGTTDYESEWEQNDYREWLANFGEFFFDSRGNITEGNPCRLFTATAAKVLVQYLADR